MTDDREIQSLREFRADLAEPSPEQQARIRNRVAGRAEGARPSRTNWRPRGALVPAMAAAAVLAVAAGAGFIAFDGSDGETPAAQPPRTSAPDQPVAPESRAVPPDKSRSAPVPPNPAEHQAAVHLLEQFAATAGTGPAPITVPQGRLLYVSGTGSATNSGMDANGQPINRELQAYKHEMWVEPAGAIVPMIRRRDGDDTRVLRDPNDPRSSSEEDLARDRAEFERTGPTFRRPSPEFLAALPTDPLTLLAQLRTSAVDSGGPWSADYAIMDFARQFLYVNEPLIPPKVRAALLHALATLDSLSSTGQPITVEGRSVYAIGQSEREVRQELLIDAQTGRIVGSRNFDSQQPQPTFSELWTHGVVATPGATP
jgi:hypothetical protein